MCRRFLTIFRIMTVRCFLIHDWALACIAVLPSYTTFMISVRQVKGLLPASFRFHLAMGTLALGDSLSATGRLRDFHPLEYAPAGRTNKRIPVERLLNRDSFMIDLNTESMPMLKELSRSKQVRHCRRASGMPCSYQARYWLCTCLRHRTRCCTPQCPALHRRSTEPQ